MSLTRFHRAVALCAALALLPAALTACGMYSPVEPDSAETSVPDDDSDTGNDQDEDDDEDVDAPATRPPTSPTTPPATTPDESQPDAGAQIETGGSGGSSGGSGGGTSGGSGGGTPGGSGGTSGGSGSSGGSGNPGGTPGPGGSGGGTSAPPPIPTTYTFALPQTDTSVTGNDGPAYGALRNGCINAINYLDATVENFMWQFNTPRYTAMYVAGLAHCLDRGDIGNALVTGAIGRYGAEGLDRIDIDPNGDPLVPQPEPLGYGEPACDLYRTLVSVRDQVDPGSLSCGAPGSTEGFTITVDPNGDLSFDDPCTFAVDESQLPYSGATSFCGPVTPDSLVLAQNDPSSLFAGWNVDPATGELVPPGAAFAALAAPPTEPEVEVPVAEAAVPPGDGPVHAVAAELSRFTEEPIASEIPAEAAPAPAEAAPAPAPEVAPAVVTEPAAPAANTPELDQVVEQAPAEEVVAG